MRKLFLVFTLSISCLVFQAEVLFYPHLKEGILNLLSSASWRVLVSSFSVNDPEFLAILTELRDRGVVVRVISEIPVPDFENRVDSNPDALLHAKFLIVDNVVVFGSANFTESGLERDMNDFIVFRDERVVSFFEDLFRSVWNNEPPPSYLETDFGTFYVAPFEDLERVVSEILLHAKRSVKLSIFAFTDGNVLGVLKHLTSRGVRVEIIADDWCEKNESFLSFPTDQFHVKVIENVHHKFVIVDDEILITGSANITESGYHRNFEVIFVTSEDGIVEKYVEYFERLWR